MGWFTEVRNDISLKIPMVDTISYIVMIQKGKIYCNLPEKGSTSFVFKINEGDIYLKLNSNLLTLVGDSSKIEKKAGMKVIFNLKKRMGISLNLI
jgi:hypothetical protein